MSSRASYADSGYVDAQGRTDAELYLMGVLDGSVVAGQKVIKLAKKMLPRIRDGYKRWHYDASEATRPVEFIEKFCMIPSGKLGVPFVLEPYERMIVELTFGFVDDDGVRQIQYTLVEMARKQGKALSLDTEIPTPDGWKRMADIHPGDYVYGQDGKPSKVLVESEIFDKPMYLVTFEDGAQIKASGDHVWTVKTKRSCRTAKRVPKSGKRSGNGKRYRDGGWYETTTQEMFDDPSFLYLRADGKGLEYKYRVPMCLPVEYPERDLPIDPYVLGAWLGDGTSTKPQITIGAEDEDEMVRIMSCHGHTVTLHRYPSDDGTRANTYDIDHHPRGHGNGPFKQKLIDLDLIGNKHIPDEYMHASAEQRWELVRGLMDTDGTCSASGQCEFTQKSEVLARQTSELLSSLGIKAVVHSKRASCNGVPAGIVYRIQFYTDKQNPCFMLGRKRKRLKDKLAPRMSCKSITSIERIPNEPSKCIAIDNDSHLYLAGRQYTATHNTSLAAAMEIYMLVADGEGAPQIYNAATSKSQASLAYGAVWRMVRQSPKLMKYLRKGVITERAETGVICDANMGYVVPLSKQSDHLDGLDVHFSVLDEMAAMTDRSTYDLVKQGMGARTQPLMVVITTQGFVRDNIWDQERAYADKWLNDEIDDDRFLGILFEQDDRSEIWDESKWMKSNPGLGTVKKTEYLRAQVVKAKNDPTYMPTLLVKDFNIAANSVTSFFTREECICVPSEFELKDFRYGILGVDAADSIDLNAATLLTMKPGDDRLYRYSMYWLPEVTLEQKGNSERERDIAPYRQWVANGWMRTCPGNRCDKMIFVDFVQELAEQGVYIKAIGYDPWHMDDNTLRYMKMAVGEANVIPVRQGPQTLSQPLKQIKADMRDGHILTNGNPCDVFCNSNVSVKEDTNGNLTVVKKTSNARVDGFISMLNAYKVLMDRYDDFRAAVNI